MGMPLALKRNFWRQPVPRWVRRLLLAGGAALAIAAALAAGGWFYFHLTYENWLSDPPERLIGYQNRLITDGRVLDTGNRSALESAIDTHLITWRQDHAHIAELSRSEVLHYRLLGRAYVKVFLHTRLDEDDGGRRVEFVSEFIWRGGQWRWYGDYNLALE